MSNRLTGKRALITGSSRGIGLGIATGLAKLDAAVVLHARSRDAAEAAVDELRRTVPGAEVSAVAGDLGSSESAESAFQGTGNIDILVNNAGVFDGASAFELDDDAWRRMFEINVFGAVRAIRHFGPKMSANGWGRIVNISSEAGSAPVTELIHYSASKAALNSVSRGFAQALMGTGVTVNTVIVGPTEHENATESRKIRAADAGISYEEYQRRFFAEHRPTALIARYVKVEEIAALVGFIVSEEAGFVTGAPWRADCGSLTSIS